MASLSYEVIRVDTKGYDAVDLIEYVMDAVERHGVVNGLVHLFTRSNGVFLLFIEYESGLLRDLEDFMDRLREAGLRGSLVEGLFSKNIIVPVLDGDTALGVFKHPVLVDVSGEPGSKEVLLVVESY